MSHQQPQDSTDLRIRRRALEAAIARWRGGGPADVETAPERGGKVDLELLEQQVRQGLQRLLGREVRAGGRSPQSSSVDLALLEEMIRQLLPPALPGQLLLEEPDSDLIERRIRTAIRRALREYRDLTTPRLSDAGVDRLIDRVLDRS